MKIQVNFVEEILFPFKKVIVKTLLDGVNVKKMKELTSRGS